jgi:predicted enzyme related to lactoylglutathione lyase
MPSDLVWLELTADDSGKARKFYEELFGWETSDAGGYTMIQVAAAKEVGAGIKPGMGAAGASHWAPYVSVENVVKATKKAKSLGAELVEDTHETPNGIVSTIKDPTGGLLHLWEPLPAAK